MIDNTAIENGLRSTILKGTGYGGDVESGLVKYALLCLLKLRNGF